MKMHSATTPSEGILLLSCVEMLLSYNTKSNVWPIDSLASH